MSERAFADNEAIQDWIEEQAPTSVDSWRDALMRRIEVLAMFPLGRPVADEHRSRAVYLRFRLHGAYKIFFHVEARRVIVVAVRHASRDEPTRSA